MYFIGVDLGTSAVKLLLMEESGKICNIVSKEYPLFFPHPGWSEQNPEDWFTQSVEGMKELTEGIDRSLVAGIGFGGQMHGLVLLDENGEPDSVGYDQIPQPDGTIRFYFEFAGREGGIERAESYDVILSIANWEVTPEGEWLREEPDNTWLKDEWVVTVTPEMKGEAQ